jgi:hypothetical protein
MVYEKCVVWTEKYKIMKQGALCGEKKQRLCSGA